jgi:hypothetical protein
MHSQNLGSHKAENTTSSITSMNPGKVNYAPLHRQEDWRHKISGQHVRLGSKAWSNFIDEGPKTERKTVH